MMSGARSTDEVTCLHSGKLSGRVVGNSGNHGLSSPQSNLDPDVTGKTKDELVDSVVAPFDSAVKTRIVGRFGAEEFELHWALTGSEGFGEQLAAAVEIVVATGGHQHIVRHYSELAGGLAVVDDDIQGPRSKVEARRLVIVDEDSVHGISGQVTGAIAAGSSGEGGRIWPTLGCPALGHRLRGGCDLSKERDPVAIVDRFKMHQALRTVRVVDLPEWPPRKDEARKADCIDHGALLRGGR